eukprot:8978647-Alexandrium_andersonii.AAC.1
MEAAEKLHEPCACALRPIRVLSGSFGLFPTPAERDRHGWKLPESASRRCRAASGSFGHA